MRSILTGVLLTMLAVSGSAQAAENIGGCQVTDYGSGVYYFKCYEVGTALASVRGLNPQATLMVTSSSWAVGSLSMGTTGYYVIVNPPSPSLSLKFK